MEAVGDARSAEKDNSYVPMADALGVRFTPFVLYTYGGFHKSALSTVEQLAAASDPGGGARVAQRLEGGREGPHRGVCAAPHGQHCD